MIETRIHMLLAERKMSQKSLSEVINIDRTTINRYYNDTWLKMSKDDMIELCVFFNCRMDDVIRCDKVPQNNTNSSNHSTSSGIIYCPLKEILSLIGMSRKELSNKTSIGANTINRYYNNTWQKFDRRHIDILCELFNIPVGHLLMFIPIEETTDETAMIGAIKFKLIQSLFWEYMESELPQESQIKLGYTPSNKDK